MQTKVKLILVVVVVVVIAAAGLLTLMLWLGTYHPINPVTGEKININAICEGALAYMSFSDGASADAFVQDCKEGKHREVIEKWKTDNGITDDRAI